MMEFPKNFKSEEEKRPSNIESKRNRDPEEIDDKRRKIIKGLMAFFGTAFVGSTAINLLSKKEKKKVVKEGGEVDSGMTPKELTNDHEGWSQ